MNVRSLVPDSALLYLTKPVSFDWKNSGLPGHYFIAEDMATIHKDLVHYDDKGRPESVNNEMLMAMTIAELKKLRVDVDGTKELHARLVDLEGEVATLKQQLAMS